MKRTPLSPEAEAAAAAIARLNEVMRKFCEDVERRKREAEGIAAVADLLRVQGDPDAERLRRLADEMGANV